MKFLKEIAAEDLIECEFPGTTATVDKGEIGWFVTIQRRSDSAFVVGHGNTLKQAVEKARTAFRVRIDPVARRFHCASMVSEN